MIGVTKGAIGNYETDANSPKASMMYKIFKALNCDANYLYQDYMDDNKQPLQTIGERALLKMFHSMNEEGKEKLIDYADDLIHSKKYIKSSEFDVVEKEAL